MNQTHLSNDVFTKFPALVPPLSEQKAIAENLDKRVEEYELLSVTAQHAIDLLLERRTALISAAVTGQIDVRNIGMEQTAA